MSHRQKFGLYMVPQGVRQPLRKIHVVGDSHTAIFSTIPECHVHNIFAKTMHGICNGIGDAKVFTDNQEIIVDKGPLDVRIFDVKPGDYVIYIFGEIDVRTHIGRIRDVHRKPLERILNDLVEKYMKVISRNTDLSHSIPIIASIVPPSTLGGNTDYPYYGSLQDRIVIQQQLNAKLKSACESRGILYLDYARHYSLPNGSLNHAFSDGHVHIRNECAEMAVQELYKLIQQK